MQLNASPLNGTGNSIYNGSREACLLIPSNCFSIHSLPRAIHFLFPYLLMSLLLPLFTFLYTFPHKLISYLFVCLSVLYFLSPSWLSSFISTHSRPPSYTFTTSTTHNDLQPFVQCIYFTYPPISRPALPSGLNKLGRQGCKGAEWRGEAGPIKCCIASVFGGGGCSLPRTEA